MAARSRLTLLCGKARPMRRVELRKLLTILVDEISVKSVVYRTDDINYPYYLSSTAFEPAHSSLIINTLERFVGQCVLLVFPFNPIICPCRISVLVMATSKYQEHSNSRLLETIAHRK